MIAIISNAFFILNSDNMMRNAAIHGKYRVMTTTAVNACIGDRECIPKIPIATSFLKIPITNELATSSGSLNNPQTIGFKKPAITLIIPV